MTYNGNIDIILNKLEHIKVDTKQSNNDIAEKLGKSKQTVSNIFKGRQPNMSLDTLMRLCNAMDCDLIIDIKKRSK